MVCHQCSDAFNGKGLGAISGAEVNDLFPAFSWLPELQEPASSTLSPGSNSKVFHWQNLPSRSL